MARTEPFVAQLAGLPVLMEALSHHRAMSIGLLAAQVGMPEKTVRELLVTYYLTDEPEERRGWTPPLRFVDEAGEDVDPGSAPLVRLTSDIVTNDLAFRYSPVDTWATSYRIARDRLHLEPENSLLEGALEKLKVAIDDDMRPYSQHLAQPQRTIRLVPRHPAAPTGRHPLLPRLAARAHRARGRPLPRGPHPTRLGGGCRSARRGRTAAHLPAPRSGVG